MLNKYYPYFTGIFVFLIYLFTLAPSVLQIDSGELAAVQSLLGIAHPTGYPLFTIAGYIFLSIPFPFTQIFTANLLAAIWCSTAVIFIIKSTELLLRNSFYSGKETTSERKAKNTKRAQVAATQIGVENFVIIAASIFAGLATAFNKTVWNQSTSVEVYSLHILLLSLIIYYSLKIYFTENSGTQGWLLASLMLAFGFSNHMTTILILPGFAILFFMKERLTVITFRKLFLMLSLFFVVLVIIYLYLPIRAAQSPVLNWGNPVGFENFMRHFTGRQYQVWIFSSFAAAKKQLIYFVSNLSGEFSVPMLALIIAGCVSAFNQSRIIFFFILTSFITTVAYSVNYDINDIDSYFILAYISLGLFSSFGVTGLFYFAKKRNINLKYIYAILFMLISFQIYSNYNDADRSDNYIFEDYTKAVLQSTEDSSIIFSYQWDYFISPSYYFQKVENFRKDVVVIDKELLRRSWYYKQLNTNHPEVIEKIGDDINGFLEALAPFERSQQFDANRIEKYFRSIMTNLISTNITDRNYYIGLELVENEMQRGEFSLPQGYNIVPHLLMFKVTSGNEYVSAPDPSFNLRFPQNTNSYIDSIKRIVVTMLISRAVYEMRFNKPGRAKLYAGKALKEFPEYKLPRQLNHLFEYDQ